MVLTSALILALGAGGAPSLAQGKTPTQAEVIEQLHQGNAQSALARADEALKDTPRDCALLSLKAVALTALSQPQPALQSLQKALTFCPAYLPALEGEAQIEYAQQSSAAVSVLTRIIALQPANVTAHAMLASMLRSQDRCAEALSHFEASKALATSRPELLEGYGSCLAKTGDLKAALAQYEQLLATDPNSTIRYNVALLQWKTHAADDALQTLAPLIAEAQSEAAFALASRISEERGDTPRAVELLRTAILMAPDQVENYLDFADIAFNHKSFGVGIDMLNAGLKRLPGSAPLFVARGVLQVQLSHNEEAIADFEQAHRLDPALSFAVDAVGIMHSQEHHSAQSLALFQEQAKLHPDDPLLHFLLAEQLAENAANAGDGNLAAAITAARRATALDPAYKAAHDLLAVLYIRAGQPRLAISEAELALAQDPNDQDALYQEILATRRSGETARLPALLTRLDEMRKRTEQKQQAVDRYRLQDEVSP